MSIQTKAACCYLFYSPLPRVFSSGYFLSWMFLAVNSTEFFCVCCPSPPLWPLQWVPQICSLMLKLSFLNWVLFVAAYISENWWTDAMGNPFSLSWLLMEHSFLVCFFKLRSSCIPSSLHWHTISLPTFFHFTISSWKETRTAEILKMQVSHRFIQRQCLLLFYFYSFLEILNSLFAALTDNEHWPNSFLDL